MLANYDDSLRHVLKYEGGFVNHPKDPGGPTNKGITTRVYDAWRVRHGQPTQSVRYITDDEVVGIYFAQYWKPICATQLAGGLDLCTFDGAVHSGVVQAAKWLQRAVHVPADGIVGVVTLAACEAASVDGESHAVIDSMCTQRLVMLKRLKTWPTFGKGWTRRVEATRKASHALVTVEYPIAVPAGDDPAEGYA